MSASQIAWAGAGRPAAPCDLVAASGVCACCGGNLDGHGVTLADIETPTTSGHADLFRFGSQYVCHACAWLFFSGKGRPGNFIATPASFETTVISMDSVVASKRPWRDVLLEIVNLPGNTPVTGVMTTDVKPRLWPRARTATIDAFGLYIHCPDYDVSEWRSFSLVECIALTEILRPMLASGFSKASLWFGLLRDYSRTARTLSAAWVWESELIKLRGSPAFLPALIASGVKIGEANGIRA